MAKKTFKQSYKETKQKVIDKKLKKQEKYQQPHKSFKRTYKEDYKRDLEVPGLMSHLVDSLKMIFKNKKLFLGLVLLVTIVNIALVGLMSEDTYTQFQDLLEENAEISNIKVTHIAKSALLLMSTVTTGGLNQGMSEMQQVYMVLLFLVLWLCTVYITRHILAGHKIKIRDALYNALTPFISTLCVLLVFLLESLPIFIVVITYSAAVQTEFLNTPFYALVYFVFAALMCLLSLYLMSGSLMALVAVSAPGLYPKVALDGANSLIVGRRIKLMIRMVFFIIALAVIWVFVMVPLIALDLWLKSIFTWLQGFPFVSFELLVMTCFSAVLMSIYFYLYYRRMLEYDN